mgnify:CR=1 FL=1
MNIVALIPARGGSKRIRKKNKKILLGKPLISWTIETAKKVKEISGIFVSTDDNEIIEIAKRFGACAPWKRPRNLSTDNASSVDVALHFLNWYEKKISKIDGLLILQPTSPFRKIGSLTKAIKNFKKNKKKSIVSFSPYISRLLNNPSSPSKIFKGVTVNKKIIKKRKLELIYISSKKNKNQVNRLNLKKLSLINGSIYLSSPKNIKKYKSFSMPDISPLIQNSTLESIDIDTYSDWKKAISLYKANKKN